VKGILITGASGFVGRHLIPDLIQPSLHIVAAIRKPQPLAPNFTYVTVGDISGSTEWSETLLDVDVIIHLAARAHVINDSVSDPEAEFYKTNTVATENLVRQAITCGVKHFIFMSSVGAMATLSDCPLIESSPCLPETPYGKSKLQAEQAIERLCNHSPMTWTIIRSPLVYGPGNPGNMARLQALIQKKLPLPLASIQNRRSFIYVESLVDAIITCMTHPKARNQTFLVSDGQDLSTPELMQKIAYYSGHPCRLVPVPLPLLQTAARCGDLAERLLNRPLPLNSDALQKLTGSLTVDSSKICHELNWHPPFTVDQGLARTLQQRSPA